MAAPAPWNEDKVPLALRGGRAFDSATRDFRPLDLAAVGGPLSQRGAYLVATLTAPYQIAHCGLEADIPPHVVDKVWQVLEAHYDSFQRALKAGVRIAMDTDQGTPVNKPGENAQEILRMAGLGMSAGPP